MNIDEANCAEETYKHLSKYQRFRLWLREKTPKVRLGQLPLYGLIYRNLMRIAHKFHWHYAPPSPINSEHRWCQWCGLRGDVFDLKYDNPVLD